MAIKEGRCVNCGSILFLDTDMAKGHCLFCDCVFDNEEAFRAHQDPASFTFPNEKQPKYEGPSLTPAHVQRGPVVAAPKPKAVLDEEPSYSLPQTKVPSLKIPTRPLVIMTALALVVIGVFCAIAFPLMSQRNQRLEAIADSYAGSLSYELDKERDLLVRELKGTDVTLVLDQDITAEESLELFNLYCHVRAQVLGLEDTSFKARQSPVTFRVVTPAGGYLISRPADQEALQAQTLNPLT